MCVCAYIYVNECVCECVSVCVLRDCVGGHIWVSNFVIKFQSGSIVTGYKMCTTVLHTRLRNQRCIRAYLGLPPSQEGHRFH